MHVLLFRRNVVLVSECRTYAYTSAELLKKVNFQYDGEYPEGLSILNEKYGAIIFWIMSCAFVVSALVTFHCKGWTEALVEDQLAWG